MTKSNENIANDAEFLFLIPSKKISQEIVHTMYKNAYSF